MIKFSIICKILKGEAMNHSMVGTIKAKKFLPKIEIKNSLLLLSL